MALCAVARKTLFEHTLATCFTPINLAEASDQILESFSLPRLRAFSSPLRDILGVRSGWLIPTDRFPDRISKLLHQPARLNLCFRVKQLLSSFSHCLLN